MGNPQPTPALTMGVIDRSLLCVLRQGKTAPERRFRDGRHGGRDAGSAVVSSGSFRGVSPGITIAQPFTPARKVKSASATVYQRLTSAVQGMRGLHDLQESFGFGEGPAPLTVSVRLNRSWFEAIGGIPT